MNQDKKFIITLKQLNTILLSIQEAPAKYVFDSINTLRSLPELKNKEKEKEK
jgi:hypothetical protein